MIDIKETTEEVVQQSSKGVRGEVGVASASQTLKKMWQNEGTKLSLKSFARQLLTTKNENRAEHKQVAQDWFDNKAGAKNAARSDLNIKTQKEASMATKLSKKAKKQ